MSTIARIRGQFYRRRLMLQCRHIPLPQRVAQQLTLHPSPRAFFREMLNREGDRFRFCYDGIDLVSPPIGESNNSDVAAAFALVIAEMQALPMLYWRTVKPSRGSTALDLGANTGTTALELARAVGPSGHVYAFEPITDETVTLNLQRNHISNVCVIPMAVGGASGEAEMLVADFSAANRIVQGLSHLPEHPNASTHEGGFCTDRPGFQPGSQHRWRRWVRVVSLDDWCEWEQVEKVDFIKMDVEGVEEDVIRGAEHLIQRCHPAWSISSEHVDSTGRHQHKSLVSLLRSFGYRTKEIGQLYIYAWH
jgi:FkbM family methyltransferase